MAEGQSQVSEFDQDITDELFPSSPTHTCAALFHRNSVVLSSIIGVCVFLWAPDCSVVLYLFIFFWAWCTRWNSYKPLSALFVHVRSFSFKQCPQDLLTDLRKSWTLRLPICYWTPKKTKTRQDLGLVNCIFFSKRSGDHPIFWHSCRSFLTISWLLSVHAVSQSNFTSSLYGFFNLDLIMLCGCN